MSNSTDNLNIQPVNGLVQDAQGRWWEMLSPTQVFAEQAQNNIVVVEKKKKSKCHGNRKLQHFKRKCRARGLTEEQIANLIQERNHKMSEQLPNNQMLNEHTKQSHKRKRDISQQNLLGSSIKSMSQLSISKRVSKKVKNSTSKTQLSINGNNTNSDFNQEEITFYKPSKYLKMPRKLLLQSLRIQLNAKLKKKKEQGFILSRLEIFDQQFCLDKIRSLYQTYFDLGLKHQIWPVSLTSVLYKYTIKLIYFEG